MIRQFTEKDKNSSQTYDKILNLINKETHKTWSRMSTAFHLPFLKNCRLYFNKARKFFFILKFGKSFGEIGSLTLGWCELTQHIRKTIWQNLIQHFHFQKSILGISFRVCRMTDVQGYHYIINPHQQKSLTKRGTMGKIT